MLRHGHHSPERSPCLVSASVVYRKHTKANDRTADTPAYTKTGLTSGTYHSKLCDAEYERVVSSNRGCLSLGCCTEHSNYPRLCIIELAIMLGSGARAYIEMISFTY